MKPSVIVTGASGGIGSQICEQFYLDGYDVIGIDRVPSKWTLNKSLDLKHLDLFAMLESSFDTRELKCIVHAAAEQILGKLEDQSSEVWNQTMWTNVMSLDNLVRNYAGVLEKNRGSVVLVGSVHAVASRAEVAIYAISKAAAEGWVRSAAIEYAPGIRINSVVPGAIKSGKLVEFFEAPGNDGEAIANRITGRTPMRRLGEPVDVANAVQFLSGSKSTFITGQSLIIDGGATLLLATEVD